MTSTDDLLVPLVNAPHQHAAVERALEAGPVEEDTVLNVVTPLDEPFSEGRVLTVDEQRRSVARARARRVVETATGRPASSVNVEVAEGRPARTVVEHAAEHGTDRTVVGGRDRSPLSRVLFGRSVGAAIAARTDVTVTVVEEPD